MVQDKPKRVRGKRPQPESCRDHRVAKNGRVDTKPPWVNTLVEALRVCPRPQGNPESFEEKMAQRTIVGTLVSTLLGYGIAILDAAMGTGKTFMAGMGVSELAMERYQPR